MSLRQVDPGIKRLWEKLEDEEEALVVERRRLHDIWKKISAMHRANAEARQAFEKEAGLEFLCGEDRVLLNVGGHTFETTAGVLCRDRYSVLAFLCKTEQPVSKDTNGAFIIDRDWWIFRYILQFLRTGDLPQDPTLLREIYEESSIYRLNSLRRAIQQRAATTTAAHGVIPAFSRNRPSHSNPPPEQRPVGASAIERGFIMRRPSAQTESLFKEMLPDPFGFCRK